MWKEIKQESKHCNASPETSFPVSNNSTYVSSVGICCCCPLLGNSGPPKGQLHEIFIFSQRSLSSTSKLAEHCSFETWHSSKRSGSKTRPNFQSTCLNLFEPVTMDYGPWTMSGCLNAKPGQKLNLLSVIIGTTITWSSATAAGVHRHGHG